MPSLFGVSARLKQLDVAKEIRDLTATIASLEAVAANPDVGFDGVSPRLLASRDRDIMALVEDVRRRSTEGQSGARAIQESNSEFGTQLSDLGVYKAQASSHLREMNSLLMGFGDDHNPSNAAKQLYEAKAKQLKIVIDAIHTLTGPGGNMQMGVTTTADGEDILRKDWIYSSGGKSTPFTIKKIGTIKTDATVGTSEAPWKTVNDFAEKTTEVFALLPFTPEMSNAVGASFEKALKALEHATGRIDAEQEIIRQQDVHLSAQREIQTRKVIAKVAVAQKAATARLRAAEAKQHLFSC
jgi:hypothetical protein